MDDDLGRYPNPEGESDMADLTDEERKLINRVDDMVRDGRLATHHNRADLDHYSYWRKGEEYSKAIKKVRGKEQAKAVANRCFPIIEQQVSMMTDNNPKGVFLPQETSDITFVKDIDALVTYRARRLNMRARLIRAAKSLKVFGRAGAYIYYDDGMPGQGDVDTRLLQRKELIVDPLLNTCNPEDGEYVGIDRQVSLEYLKYKWPEKAEELQKEYGRALEGSDPLTEPDEGDTLDGALGYSPDANPMPSGAGAARKMSMLTTVWYKDYAEKEIKQSVPIERSKLEGKVVENAIGQYVYALDGRPWTAENAPIETVKLPAYPYGRCTIKSGNVILEDYPWGETSKVMGDQVVLTVEPAHWPIALAANVIIPDRWQGMSEIEALRGDQDNANEMASTIKDHCKDAVRPRRKAEMTAVEDRKAVERNDPDKVIWMKQGRMDGFEWVDPSQLSPDVYRSKEGSERNMEVTSGMPSQNMGISPERKQTATLTAVLDRAGRGRVGMSSALLDEFISRIYLLMAECIQRNYDAERIMNIIGEDGAPRAITITAKHKTVRFDVEVEAGSTLPYDKDQKKEESLVINRVLTEGGPYLSEILDAFEVKNKEEILARSQAYQMFMQLMPLMGHPAVQEALQIATQEMQQQEQGTQQGGQANANAQPGTT